MEPVESFVLFFFVLFFVARQNFSREFCLEELDMRMAYSKLGKGISEDGLLTSCYPQLNGKYYITCIFI